jgi:hypothetical protein
LPGFSHTHPSDLELLQTSNGCLHTTIKKPVHIIIATNTMPQKLSFFTQRKYIISHTTPLALLPDFQ